MKKLPNVFVNKIDKQINNNETVFYSSNKETEKVLELPIYDKITEMYKDVPFIYKKEVEITLKDKVFKTKVINYNKKSLITLDNQIIVLDDIIDIKFVE